MILPKATISTRNSSLESSIAAARHPPGKILQDELGELNVSPTEVRVSNRRPAESDRSDHRRQAVDYR